METILRILLLVAGICLIGMDLVISYFMVQSFLAGHFDLWLIPAQMAFVAGWFAIGSFAILLSR